MSAELITFFHNSDELRSEFSHKDSNRPCFYWFADRFHSHTGYLKKDKYFYMFVKDPIKESITLIPRNNEDHSFHALYNDFLFFKHNTDYQEYLEPPILMSYDRIVPDLIAEYSEETNEYKIVKPDIFKHMRFKLYDDSYKHQWAKGPKFTDIQVLNKSLPLLANSLPLTDPKIRNGKYIFKNWLGAY